MRVLIIAAIFWPDYAGWVNQVLGLINSCAPQDCSFTVVTRQNPDRDEQHPVLRNTEIVELHPSITAQNVFSRFLFIIPVLCYLIKNQKEYDLIFLPTAYLPLPLIIPAARSMSKPVVSRIAINELIGTNLFSKIRKSLILSSDAIVCLNKQTAEGITGRKDDRPIVRFIPNGIDYAKHNGGNKETGNSFKSKLGFSKDDKIVTFAGLINERKGVDTLIKSFHRIRNTAHTHLLLVGPYQDANEIEPQFVQLCMDLANEDKMKEKIHFIGRVDNMKEYLQISDIFVLPSLSEGMPNVLLEAMAAGLPCVCSDIPGIREIIKPEKNGILVPPGDVEGFAEAISRLLSDSKLRSKMGRESIRQIERYHTMQRISGLYRELFMELIEHKKRNNQ